MHRTRVIEYALVFIVALGIAATVAPKYEHDEIESVVRQNTATTTFLVVGDMMLGRHVGELMRTNGNDFPFKRIAPLLDSVDFVLANLEGPITLLDNEPDNMLRFQFDPSVAEAIRAHNIKVVSLANNHWGDQGSQGHQDTRRYLNEAGVAHIGLQMGTQLGGIVTAAEGRVTLIGLDTTITLIDHAKFASELRALGTETHIVALVHWGEEYAPFHNEAQEAFAHFLIDNGVDAVIGAHPHVVQDVATYKEKPIFYSIGNFIFDQYWNEEVQTGLAVKVTVTDDIAFETINLKSENSQPFEVFDAE